MTITDAQIASAAIAWRQLRHKTDNEANSIEAYETNLAKLIVRGARFEKLLDAAIKERKGEGKHE